MKYVLLICAILIAGSAFAQGKPAAKSDSVKTEVAKSVTATISAEEQQAIATTLDNALQLISKSDAPAREADLVRQQLLQVKQFIQERFKPKETPTPTAGEAKQPTSKPKN